MLQSCHTALLCACTFAGTECSLVARAPVATALPVLGLSVVSTVHDLTFSSERWVSGECSVVQVSRVEVQMLQANYLLHALGRVCCMLAGIDAMCLSFVWLQLQKLTCVWLDACYAGQGCRADGDSVGWTQSCPFSTIARLMAGSITL
jgi:hypothetical protein